MGTGSTELRGREREQRLRDGARVGLEPLRERRHLPVRAKSLQPNNNRCNAATATCPHESLQPNNNRCNAATATCPSAPNRYNRTTTAAALQRPRVPRHGRDHHAAGRAHAHRERTRRYRESCERREHWGRPSCALPRSQSRVGLGLGWVGLGRTVHLSRSLNASSAHADIVETTSSSGPASFGNTPARYSRC